MQCVYVLALCCVGVILATPVFLDSELDDLWDVYKKNHNKQYELGNEKMRWVAIYQQSHSNTLILVYTLYQQ